MVTGKDGVCQVIEGTMAHSAEVSLSVGLSFVVSVFDDVGGVAVRTFDFVFPSKVSHHFITLGIIDQSLLFSRIVQKEVR